MSRIHNRDKGAATTDRQNKHKPGIHSTGETLAEVEIPRPNNADMSMLKAELIEIAEAMELDTKGTKQELVDRIQA